MAKRISTLKGCQTWCKAYSNYQPPYYDCDCGADYDGDHTGQPYPKKEPDGKR